MIQRLLETNLQKFRHKLINIIKIIFEETGRFEESRLEHARLKRDLRKGNITEQVTELTCGQ